MSGQRWAILASHARRDEIRFHCKHGTHSVVTFPTEEACRREIAWIDRRRKAGQATGFDGFNLYPQRLNADRLD